MTCTVHVYDNCLLQFHSKGNNHFKGLDLITCIFTHVCDLSTFVNIIFILDTETPSICVKILLTITFQYIISWIIKHGYFSNRH